jgi:hypothetical protein
MATPESAKKKWERKLARAAPRWKAAISPEKYAKGMADFGIVVGPETLENYKEGIAAVTAEDFQAAVRGKGDKWLAKLKEGLEK